jgi:tellurite resistance protein
MPIGSRKRKNKTPLLSSRRQAAIQNIAGICEAAFLAAAADGELSDAEYDVLVHTIIEFCDGDVTEQQIEEILEKCDNALAEDGFENRMNQISSQLSTNDARAAALMVTAAVVLCDGEYDPDSEGSFYDDLAELLEVPEEVSAEIWNATLESFGLE